jgi:hypothetical protein
VAVGAAATSGTIAAVGGGLTVAGFTSTGIAAGSIAAGVQAGIGNVAAGSAFAVLQSMGATGLIAAVGTGAVVALPIIGGAYYLYNYFYKK